MKELISTKTSKLSLVHNMKKLLIVSLLLLSGCSFWNPATFDTNEYLLTTRVRTLSQGDCSKSNIDRLYFTSLELKNFSQYLPYNDKTASMTNNLFTIVDGIHSKETISDVYCKSKLQIISKSSEEIQQIIGQRPR
jgi:hypothetical protein